MHIHNHRKASSSLLQSFSGYALVWLSAPVHWEFSLFMQSMCTDARDGRGANSQNRRSLNTYQQFFYASVQISAHARPTNSDVVLMFLWKKQKKRRAEMAEIDTFCFFFCFRLQPARNNLQRATLCWWHLVMTIILNESKYQHRCSLCSEICLLWISANSLSEDELLNSHMGEGNEDSGSYNLITPLEEAVQEFVWRAADGR